MELVDVSSFFDRTPAKDPDTGVELFRCQLLAYEESKRDAYTAYRRILSTAPSVVTPAGRVVNIHGTNWLLGTSATDGWGVEHRRKYVIHAAQGLVKVHRLAGFLTGTPAATLWGDLQWVVDKKELEVSSRVPQRFAAILPEIADVRVGDILTLGDTTVMVSSKAQRVSGFLEADGMAQWMSQPVTVEVHTRTYSPSAGGYSNQTTDTVPGLKARWQEMYTYDDQLAERYQDGDCTWVLPEATQISTSSELVHGQERFTVLSVQVGDDCKLIHARLK